MPMVGGMLAVVGSFAGSAALGQDVPAAKPAAVSSTLPVIGRSRSKRYCSVETERTNGAITVALLNDKIISTGIGRLRTANLDNPDITLIEREKAMHDLRAVAAAIQTNVRAGDSQLSDLRTLSVHEPDSTRSAELKLLAERIDAALAVQRGVGADLAKMLTIVEGRAARGQAGMSAAEIMPETRRDHVGDGLPSIDERAQTEPLNALFKDVADDFGERAIQIGKAEDAAAVHAPRAVAGC